MRAEILAVGSELTSGATVNTNAAFLGRRLTQAGLRCDRQTTVSDDRRLLRQAIAEALARCDVLILTGGLGPTFDDVTVEALARVLKRKLRFMPAAASAIRRFYAKRHRVLQEAALRQAYLPYGAVVLPNPIGTAPGVWIKASRRTIIALPGVPSEMRAIMDRSVMPRLRALRGRGVVLSRTLRTLGLVELQIQKILESLPIPKALEVGLYPNSRMVDVRLTATARTHKQARALLAPVERALRRRLGSGLYATGNEPLESVFGRQLIQKGWTLSVAESCTGGLLMARLTEIPGSSQYLRGGVVAYSNALKQKLLGVPARLLRRHGAVSADVARAMAQGIRRRSGSTLGLSVTGIAGPGGATHGKPVGLVFLGLSDARRALSQSHRFAGDRQSIRTQAVQSAMGWLRAYALELGRVKGKSARIS